VLAVCDRVVVLRLGALASTLAGGELNAENLVGYITGAKTGNGRPAGPDAEVN
jgi:ABC-type sugar transport system ATPase subunit